MKLTTTILFLFSFVFAFAQEQKIIPRVMLDKDSLPIFDKKVPTLNFTNSFFYCYADLDSTITANQFNSFDIGIKGVNSEITCFLSPDKKSVVAIFPKQAERGISNLNTFINSHFQNSSFPTATFMPVKHIEIVNQFDPLDKNKGFN